MKLHNCQKTKGHQKGSSLTQKGRVLKLDLGNPFKVAITREEDLPPPANTLFYTLLCDGCKCCTTATSSIVCTNNAPESRTYVSWSRLLKKG